MHLQLLAATLLSLIGPGRPDDGDLGTVPYENCRWIGGDYGQQIDCNSNELMVGSCGSGKDPDCKDDHDHDVYTLIKCCSIYDLTSINCTDDYGDHGEHLFCPDDGYNYYKFVKSICGSGGDADCSGNYHMISCCERTFDDGNMQLIARENACYWLYGNYGYRRECNDNEVVAGRCGSGRDADCGDNQYMGILCCQFSL